MTTKQVVLSLATIALALFIGCRAGLADSINTNGENQTSEANRSPDAINGYTGPDERGSDMDNAEAKTQKVISRLATQNGRTYIEYLGNPYLMYGVQIRIDFMLGTAINDPAKLEETFMMAKEVGFRTVIVPISWLQFEIEKDIFDYWYIRSFVDWCNKYDLDLQLIWFGSNICGGNWVPGYLWLDPAAYPRADFPPAANTHLKYDNPNFIERETNAIGKMFEWLEENDTNHRVSMVQLNNEPDGAADMDNIPWDGTHEELYQYLWGGGQAEGSMAVMDALGQTVKSSGYQVVTRVNFVNTILDNEVNVTRRNLRKTFDLPGVDIVGIDNYARPISVYDRFMDYLHREVPEGNVPHVPEASGAQDNMINKAMHAFSRGEGYLIYEIRTVNTTGTDNDGGVYRIPSARGGTEWVERDGTVMLPGFYHGDWEAQPENITSEVRAFNNLIYKAAYKLATLPFGSITAYNTENVNGPYVSPDKRCGIYRIGYESPTGGEAMALCDTNGDVILLSLYDESKFIFPGKAITGNASVGYFTNSGEWTTEREVEITGEHIMLSAGECVRIPADNIGD